MSNKDTLIKATETLDESTQSIVNDLVTTEDPQQIQDLTALFNINNTKKNAIRIMKLGELWDCASTELLKRVSENPDLHCNDDLVKYLTLAESGMEKASKTLGNVDVSPIIQINQQNNTVNIGQGQELSRDDRLKVMEVVKNILQKAQPVTEITEVEEGDNDASKE